MSKSFYFFFTALHLFSLPDLYAGFTEPLRLTEDIPEILSQKAKLSQKNHPHTQIENWTGSPIQFEMAYVIRPHKNAPLEQYESQKVVIPKGHEIIFIPESESLQDYSISWAKVNHRVVFDRQTEKEESIKSSPIWNLHIFNDLRTQISKESKTAQINISSPRIFSPADIDTH